MNGMKSKKKTETKADVFINKPGMATKQQLAGYIDLIRILKTDEKTVQTYINDRMHLNIKSPEELTFKQMDKVLGILSSIID